MYIQIHAINMTIYRATPRLRRTRHDPKPKKKRKEKELKGRRMRMKYDCIYVHYISIFTST